MTASSLHPDAICRSMEVRRARSVRVMAAVALALLLVGGCTPVRYLSNRPLRDNPLTTRLKLVSWSGPQISDRSQQTLQRYDLVDDYERDCGLCLDELRRQIRRTGDPELIHALAELSYVEGTKAKHRGQTADALNHYGLSLTSSYDYLFSSDLGETRNPFDPQFRSTCDLYNQSLEETLRLLCDQNRLKPGQTYTIETPEKKFVVRTEMRGSWDADEFDHYEFVSDYRIETLRNRHTTFGLGVPLIAVRKEASDSDDREGYYPDGLSYSVTALMRCVPATGELARESRGGKSSVTRVGKTSTVFASAGLEETAARVESDGERMCVLEFFDPLSTNQIQLAGDWVPLETDLTTPLAFFLDSPDFRRRNAATEGLLNPHDSQARRGLYMLEPYDPDRIPVVMVHGLWSSPLTWMDMFNDLRSFPEIRRRYQFWFYLYPSGQPFWISATQLRGDLRDMRHAFDPSHRDRAIDQMVLVGHSMGGLVSRMQTIESEDQFWRIVSDVPVRGADDAFNKLQGNDEDRFKLVSTLFFKPNQSVQRVVTIGTPHRGSKFANDYTRWLASRVIRLPQMAVRTGKRLLHNNPSLFKHTGLLSTQNAVDSLAEDSPIFPVMLRAKRNPRVKYHNIVGVLESPSLLQSRAGRGDGVVAYNSAHMDDVESELVVDADHTSIHMTPKAIFEVRRILLEHLRELDGGDRIASLPVHVQSDQPSAPSPVRHASAEAVLQ